MPPYGKDKSPARPLFERSMKDRNAFEAPKGIIQGMTPQQAYDSVAEKKGIPMHQVREGVLPAQKGFPPQGIPFDSPGPQRVAVPVCSATKKDGTPCKARPITGRNICIGHSRVKHD